MSSRLRPWHHNTQQYTLLEFASLQQTCPEGIYLSLNPGAPAQWSWWSGVLFVRKGPYAPAILRFLVSFSPDYPTLPPSITFINDIFHPLVAPLTTYTYTTGSSNLDTVSASDEERLSPGGFSLRHGFPHWFRRNQKSSAASSGASSRDVSGSHGDGSQNLRDAVRPPPGDTSSRDSSTRPLTDPYTKPTSIIEVLQYIKRSFDDEGTLDTLPLDAAGNSGAWKAWRAHRKSTNQDTDILASEAGVTQQNEWSWDGVWEERVRKGIDASKAESTLYGGGGDELIRFADLGDDLIEEVKRKVVGSVDGCNMLSPVAQPVKCPLP